MRHVPSSRRRRSSVRLGQARDESPAFVLLQRCWRLRMSFSFLEDSLEHYLSSCPSRAELLLVVQLVLCLRVPPLYLCFGLSSSDVGVATVVCFSMVLCRRCCPGGCFAAVVAPLLRMLCRRSRSPLADALPRVSGGCFAAVVASSSRMCRSPLADALSRGLWRMLCCRVATSSRVGFPACPLADALPSCWLFGWMICRQTCLLAVEALPPPLHLPSWQSFALVSPAGPVG
jgi:hypothetical protein